MSLRSSGRSRITPRWISQSVVMLLIAGMTPLMSADPIGSLRELLPTQNTIRVRRADKTRKQKKQRHTPTLPPAFQKALAGRLASANRAVAGEKFTLAQLNAMNYTDMVNTIAGINWEDVTDLWTYSPSAQAFYGDSYRVQALIDAIGTRTATFTETDSKGIPTLVEVLRAGFYHGWYHPKELPAMNDRNTHDKCLPAIRKAQANPFFDLKYSAGCDVITAMGMLIGNGSCDPGIVKNFKKVLDQFSDNFESYAKVWASANAWSQVCTGIDYDLGEMLYDNNGGKVDPATLTQWYGQIDAYLESIFKIASKPLASYTTDTGWAIEDSIYYISSSGKLHGTKRRPLQVLTEAMDLYGRNPWKYASASAAQTIHLDYDNVDYYGKTLNWEQILGEIQKQYLPETRTFDNGLFETYFGANVSLEKMKTLIWAHKETRAQFLRSAGADTPVDPTQTSDNRLKIVVYNSPAEYRMNGILADISTNNGGMYMEGDGTFYTYERTPQESYLTLEELFRHEGVHYLQGRFLVPGSWGDSPMYDNNRMTWFEEGSAEWYSGATRTDGVKSRTTKTAYIPVDLSKRMNISTVIRSSYDDGWDFYDYSCNLMDYLFNNGHQDRYLEMTAALRAGNASGFDSLASGLTTFETAYQSHLTTLLNNSSSFPEVGTSPDYLAVHSAKPLSAVKSEIEAATGLTGTKVTVTKDEAWSTFTLRGTYTGGTRRGLKEDWTSMDAKVDGWLETLSNNGWSGYKTLTAYFVSPRTTSTNRAQYEVVFHGICTDFTVQNNQDPTAVIQAPATGTPGQPMAFSAAGSSDPDGSIVSYHWDFGDGTTADGLQANKTYAEAGTFTVTLTVEDNAGGKNSTTLQVKVDKPQIVTTEWEPNNSIETACGHLGNGLDATGSLAIGSDNKDYFFFEAKSAGKVTIGMKAKGTATTTWQLFHESKPGTYVSYMKGESTEVEIPADKLGRYYVMIYCYGTGSSTYTLNVAGSPMGTNDTQPLAITTQPAPQQVAVGAQATFSVVASGSGLTYQWQRNEKDIPGATASTYTTPACTATEDGVLFSVIVTDASGKKVASSPAKLSVATVPQELSMDLVITTSAGKAVCDSNAKDSEGIDKVLFWVDYEGAVEVTAAPYQFVIDTTAMEAGSEHQVYCRVYSTSGKSVDSGWSSFTVDPSTGGGGNEEALSITLATQVDASGTMNCTARTTGTPVKVTFYTDSWNRATVDTAAPWAAVMEGLSQGSHYVLAEAEDAEGRVASSTWVRVMVP